MRSIGSVMAAMLPRHGFVVAALDQQPLPRPRALQREAAAQLLAMQDEHRVAALERLGPCHPSALLVRPAVPHLAALRTRGLDGQALDPGIERRLPAQRPRARAAADLQAQLVTAV